MVHVCHLNTWEVETGRSGVHGHPWLHSKFKASLSYMGTCLKTNIIQTKKKAFDHMYIPHPIHIIKNENLKNLKKEINKN